MKTTEIINGTYLLTAPVDNPAADRRSASWHKNPVFEPGRYYVSTYDERREVGPVVVHFLTVTVRKAREHGNLSVIFRAGDDGYKNVSDVPKALAAEALVTSEAFQRDTSLSGSLQYAEAEDWVSFRCVIERLVREGSVSEDAVQRAIAAEIAEQGEEVERENA